MTLYENLEPEDRYYRSAFLVIMELPASWYRYRQKGTPQSEVIEKTICGGWASLIPRMDAARTKGVMLIALLLFTSRITIANLM